MSCWVRKKIRIAKMAKGDSVAALRPISSALHVVGAVARNGEIGKNQRLG